MFSNQIVDFLVLLPYREDVLLPSIYNMQIFPNMHLIATKINKNI